jgi:hypothetical protein
MDVIVPKTIITIYKGKKGGDAGFGRLVCWHPNTIITSYSSSSFSPALFVQECSQKLLKGST